ncbi:hypothetical protein EV361DRAFT_946765 [Lentinula raphanica]|nr:hypothetical protein FB446DRAFT_813703 [Lentinula raphanica]KAJ3974762.1 hypothetical protein EV361DRAFT_946765 [Lentinula raphanica]
MPTTPTSVHSTAPTISKGTEILCLASIIPALAVIFYISSRIMRGGSTRKSTKLAEKTATLSDTSQNIQSPVSPEIIESVVPKHPELSRQGKRESRIQDLRRYFGSSESPFSPAYKPFANHRCSISLRDPASPKPSRLSLRPLSILSVIKKKNAKTKIAKAHSDVVIQDPHPFPDDNTIRLWQIADTVVGAHPQAMPLRSRSSSQRPNLRSENDCRLVSHSRVDIPWYKPEDKAAVIIAPAIARSTSSKASGTTSVKSLNSERYPDVDHSPVVSADPAPSKSPVVLSPTDHAISSSPIQSPLAQAPPTDEPTLSPQPNTGLSSATSSSSQRAESSSPISDVAPSPTNTTVTQNSRLKASSIPWEDRVPGLVTVSPISHSRSPASAAARTGTMKNINNTRQGPRRELKLVTNLQGMQQVGKPSNVEKSSLRQTSGNSVNKAVLSTTGVNARFRETRNKKSTPNGKENVPIVGAAF